MSTAWLYAGYTSLVIDFCSNSTELCMYKPLYIIAGNLIWLSTANSSNVSAEINA